MPKRGQSKMTDFFGISSPCKKMVAADSGNLFTSQSEPMDKDDEYVPMIQDSIALFASQEPIVIELLTQSSEKNPQN